VENNKVKIVGTVFNEIIHDHQDVDEDFYMVSVAVGRKSGAYDILPVMVSERILTTMQLIQGMRVVVEGSFRSYNLHIGDESKLKLYIFADLIAVTDSLEDENNIYLNGFICKDTSYRETPLGRKICDAILAVNRHTRNSDYIPVIVWSRNAAYLSCFNIGDRVTLTGRVQSREYNKTTGDSSETRTAYEVSAEWVEAFKAGDRSDRNECSTEAGVL
jgi:single-stranded DNA-binding protein